MIDNPIPDIVVVEVSGAWVWAPGPHPPRQKRRGRKGSWTLLHHYTGCKGRSECCDCCLHFLMHCVCLSVRHVLTRWQLVFGRIKTRWLGYSSRLAGSHVKSKENWFYSCELTLRGKPLVARFIEKCTFHQKFFTSMDLSSIHNVCSMSLFKSSVW